MIVIPPIEITPSLLVSSTVPAISAGETAWVSGETCAVNVVRIYQGGKYTRLIAGAGTTAPPPDDPINWGYSGPSNRMAMFDLYRNGQTVGASPLTVVIAPGKRINSFALGGLDATSAEVTMTVAGEVVYHKTYQLNQRKTKSWSQYYFGGFSTKPSMIDFDLPPYSSAQVTVTLTNVTGSVKCGACVIGTSVFLGGVRSAGGTSLNFSVIRRDDFSNAELRPRRGVPKTSQILFIDRDKTDQVRNVKKNLDAVPAVWCGSESTDSGIFELLLIFGIWRQFDIDSENVKYTKINLEVEEI